MIRYMLDTDACIALIKNRPETMRRRLLDLSPQAVGVSSIVTAELWFGISRSRQKKKNEAALKDFLEYASPLDWPVDASPLHGEIRAGLQKQGTPIGAMDLLIAVHTLFLGGILVTNNTREFSRLPGLKIENWISD